MRNASASDNRGVSVYERVHLLVYVCVLTGVRVHPPSHPQPSLQIHAFSICIHCRTKFSVNGTQVDHYAPRSQFNCFRQCDWVCGWVCVCVSLPRFHVHVPDAFLIFRSRSSKWMRRRRRKRESARVCNCRCNFDPRDARRVSESHSTPVRIGTRTKRAHAGFQLNPCRARRVRASSARETSGAEWAAGCWSCLEEKPHAHTLIPNDPLAVIQ